MTRCEVCDGTGEVETWERVWRDEPHTAPIGVATCSVCNGTGEVDVAANGEIVTVTRDYGN